MSDGNNKRKQNHGGSHGGPSAKRSKGGNAGRWRTAHHKAKVAEKVEMGTTFSVGDEGIWVTFAKGMKFKAVREFRELCEAYGKEMYGIPTSDEKAQADDDDEDQDIEQSIEQELSKMRSSQKPKFRQVFTPVSTGIECLFFMKTMEPVEPDKLALKICQDARKCTDPMSRKVKYVNRLAPVLDTEKATEKGIPKVARSVLSSHFELNPEVEGDAEATSEAKKEGEAEPKDGDSPVAHTYAIRQNIRNHDIFRSDAVIKMVAGLISPRHKVNLTNPDKVILIEIFQSHCGMSVVDGREWEALKRYNINEVYKLASEEADAGASKKEEDGEASAPKA